MRKHANTLMGSVNDDTYLCKFIRVQKQQLVIKEVRIYVLSGM